MRHFITIILSVLLLSWTVSSCKKWEDPVSQEEPRLSNTYCNDPEAINYNWGFPGKPDNTVCVYGADLFAGNYTFNDTVHKVVNDLFLYADTRYLKMTKITNTRLRVDGFCEPGVELRVTARSAYRVTVDSTFVDSLTERGGQLLCRREDTVSGSFTRDKVDSSLVYISLTVISDTGVTTHIGRARLQK
jgi:hypothetical protein